ncbi:MAG: helix-turn-helix domain-containing protein, partial [Pirellulales bacterium]
MDKSLKLESEKVRSIRKLTGLNQKKFGEAVGVSISTIFRWENGERDCSGDSVRKILAFERSLNVETAPSTSIFQLSTEHLSRLSSDRAVSAFRDLLWAMVAQAGVPKSNVKISAREVSDGGIDAEVLDVLEDCKFGFLQQGGNFYQLKTGNSKNPCTLSFAKNELLNTKKDGLGSEVKICAESNGLYILVCFGHDLTPQQNQQAKHNFEAVFKSQGYPNPKVQVWSQQELIGFFEHFPSLCLRLSDRESTDFQSWSNWKNEREMSRLLQLGQPQKMFLADIQSFLHTKEISHIRIIGEPGLGKTRLVLEALADVYFQSYVIYVVVPEKLLRLFKYRVGTM